MEVTGEKQKKNRAGKKYSYLSKFLLAKNLSKNILTGRLGK